MDQLSNQPIAFANIYVQGTESGSITDSTGTFELLLNPGLYNLEITYEGYRTSIVYSKLVNSSAPAYLRVELEPAQTKLAEVSVVAKGEGFLAHTPIRLGLMRLLVCPVQQWTYPNT